MAGELITLDRHVELQGLLMGPGTPYKIESFNPWGWPDIASGDIGRPQRHGLLTGRDLMRGRRVTMVINIVAAGKQAALEAMHVLAGAWQPIDDSVPFVWKAGERTYRINGRPRLADPNPAKVPAGVIRVECRFLGTDPFIYDNTEQNDDTTFPASTDLYTESYTETYEDPLTNGRTIFDNEGKVDAPWQALITGPWVNPKVQLVDHTDPTPLITRELAIDITLGADDTLYIDTDRELFYVNDIVRLDLATLDLDWFAIPPGEWDLRFDGDSGTGTAEAWMRSTWL